MKCETILSTNQLNQVNACTQVHIYIQFKSVHALQDKSR